MRISLQGGAPTKNAGASSESSSPPKPYKNLRFGTGRAEEVWRSIGAEVLLDGTNSRQAPTSRLETLQFPCFGIRSTMCKARLVGSVRANHVTIAVDGVPFRAHVAAAKVPKPYVFHCSALEGQRGVDRKSAPKCSMETHIDQDGGAKISPRSQNS